MKYNEIYARAGGGDGSGRGLPASSCRRWRFRVTDDARVPELPIPGAASLCDDESFLIIVLLLFSNEELSQHYDIAITYTRTKNIIYLLVN